MAFRVSCIKHLSNEKKTDWLGQKKADEIRDPVMWGLFHKPNFQDPY